MEWLREKWFDFKMRMGWVESIHADRGEINHESDSVWWWTIKNFFRRWWWILPLIALLGLLIYAAPRVVLSDLLNAILAFLGMIMSILLTVIWLPWPIILIIGILIGYVIGRWHQGYLAEGEK